MNSSGVLPPQAYTREVLARAYEWYNSQPPQLRERANSADALVALFMQARRRAAAEGADVMRGNWDATQPASVEAFKADLKNLAEGLKQFEIPASAPPHTTPSPASVAPATSRSMGSNYATEPVLSAPLFPQPPQYASPPPAPAMAAPQATMSPPTPAHYMALDPRSREWVREVQLRLNLSSEADAIRALIAVGYERLRDLLPHT